ncbi:MAG: iron ABC transporter permease [Aerococcaceae bacterium]|nr:iron ABC transporter permease [Aerococcaceae bacterium]
MRSEHHYRIILALVVMACFSIIISLGLGSVCIPVDETMGVMMAKLFGQTSAELNAVTMNIIWNLRFPRVLIGFVVGAALSISGVIMQSIIRNPMADPFVLGVASGAGFFATLGLIFGVFSFLGKFALPASAFLGALVSLLIVMAICQMSRQRGVLEMLLIGVVVSMVFDAATRFIVLSAPNALGIHNTEFWMSGSLVNAKWDYFGVPISIIAIIVLYLSFHYKELNLLSLGETQAMSLGVNVRKKRFIFIVLTSLLTGITISLSGIVGFIGMICPHLARKIVGGNVLAVIPVATLMGGIAVVWADALARTIIAPVELPLGLLTAMMGGPIFLFVFIFKEKGRF